MGIDGIGGGGPPGTPRAAGLQAGEGVSVSFGRAVEGAQAADTAGVVVDVDRARLERGEISWEDYLDLQVQRATAHLVDQVPPDALELVRSELRAQLAEDPMLRTLAERVAAAAR